MERSTEDSARPNEAEPETGDSTARETGELSAPESGESSAPETSEVEAMAVANGQAEPDAESEAETSAVAISIGDTAEVTALDPHEDHLPEVAAPVFPVALRGYDRAAVDSYVVRVTELVAELQSMRSPKAAVRKALDRVGRETTAILQRAEEAADEMTADSRRRADERVQEAEREAERIVRDAHERVKQLDADTEALWAERRRLIEDVRRISDALRESADEAIARFPAEDDDSAAATPKPPPTQALPLERPDGIRFEGR